MAFEYLGTLYYVLLCAKKYNLGVTCPLIIAMPFTMKWPRQKVPIISNSQREDKKYMSRQQGREAFCMRLCDKRRAGFHARRGPSYNLVGEDERR